MPIADDLDLSGAARALATANNHTFLLRKLQEDSAIRIWAKSTTPENILGMLRATASKEPESLTEEAAPYALLVALSFSGEQRHLDEAAKAYTPYLFWYPLLVRELSRGRTQTVNKTLSIRDVLRPSLTVTSQPTKLIGFE